MNVLKKVHHGVLPGPLNSKLQTVQSLLESVTTMYNGIGLQTPRGSGTSGYIQRNLSYVKPRRSDFPLGSRIGLENHFGKGPKTRKANPELLEHDKRRKIEIQLLILSDQLKSDGLNENEVEKRIDLERQRLIDLITISEEKVTARNKADREMIAG